MRLIDADKLYPDRMTNRGTVAISQSQIANAPTVDVLDKIRADIADEKIDFDLDIGQEIHYNRAIDDVLAIIDRYREGESK